LEGLAGSSSMKDSSSELDFAFFATVDENLVGLVGVSSTSLDDTFELDSSTIAFLAATSLRITFAGLNKDFSSSE